MITIINIPPQLQSLGPRFFRLAKKDKVPIKGEKWQQKTYNHDDNEIKEHLKIDSNYGFKCGEKIIVLDTDDKIFQEQIKDSLPSTFTIKTNSGYHYYYSCTLDTKYVLKDPIRMEINKKGELEYLHIGEIQGNGSYVVAPNSIHPSGSIYEVINNAPIAKLTKDKYKELFVSYIDIKQDKDIKKYEFTDDITIKIIKDIPITEVMNNFNVDTSKRLCKCPFHETTGKGNLDIDRERNLWYCFHCGKAGTVIEFVKYILNVDRIAAKKWLCDKYNIDFDEEKERKKFADRYDLIKDSMGFLFIKKAETTKENDIELADFDGIEKQKAYILDVTRNNLEEREQYMFIMDNKNTIAVSEIDIKNILRKAKQRKILTPLTREDEQAFIIKLGDLNEREIKYTNTFGYWKDKYHDYPEWTNYMELNIQQGNEMKSPMDIIFPEEDYKHFIKLKPNIEKVMICKDLLSNKLPRNNLELINNKLIFSWSVASILKKTLRHLGIKLDPILLIIGERETGKSTIMDIGISYIWKTEPLSSDYLKGVVGTRIQTLNNDLFPRVFTEIPTLDRYANTLKDSCTRGYIQIPRGTKEGGIKKIKKFFNIAIDSNNFNCSDLALKERIISISYGCKDKGIITTEELIYLENNIKHIGKFIYDKLKEYNFEQIIKDLKDKYKDYDKRVLDKILYIKMGEYILDDIKLMDKVEIPISNILKEAAEIVDKKDILVNVINSIIAEIKIVSINDGMKNIVTAKSSLDSDDEISIDDQYEFMTKGINIVKDKAEGNIIVLNSNIFQQISNRTTKYNLFVSYKNFKQLAQDLGLKEENRKNFMYKTREGKYSSFRGLKYTFFDEEIDNNEQKKLEEK